MKWIKGKWDGTNDMLFVNPQYITAVDTGRMLCWAQDCDIGIRYDEEEYPLIIKLIGRTEEEVLDKQEDASPSKKK